MRNLSLMVKLAVEIPFVAFICLFSPHLFGQNYVTNGGFESGMYSWGFNTSGNAAASCNIDSTQGHSGQSAYLQDSSSYQPNVYGGLSQSINGLTVGKTYYVSLWCKANSNGQLSTVITGSRWQFTQVLPSGTFDWKLVQFSFIADATSVPLIVEVQDPTTSLWIDDVSITPVPLVQPQNNYVINSGFEGGMYSWGFNTSGSAAASCNIDSTQGREGQSVCLHNSSPYQANVYGALSQNINGLIVGQTYYVSLWCKGNSNGQLSTIITGSQWQFSKVLPAGTFDWTLVQFSFVADATTVPLILEVQDPTNSLWIDDIFLTSSPLFMANNNLNNAGFENGMNSWNWITMGNATAAGVIDNTQAHWEGNSFRLQESGAYQANVFGELSQNMTGLTVGQTYYVALWCKANSNGVSSQIVMGSEGQFRQSIPSGTYDWTLVQCSFVADASTVPLAIVVQDPTAALWIDDLYVTAFPIVNVNSLGIKGNDTDVTSALSTVIQSNRFLYFPTGTYVISSSINLPEGTTLLGGGPTTILLNNYASSSIFMPTFLITGTATARINNFEFAGLNFQGNDPQYAVGMEKAQNVLIRNCLASSVGLLWSGILDPYQNYNSISSESDLSSNIRAGYNTITGIGAGSATTGMFFAYAVDSLAYDNSVSSTKYGISFWGGDSNYSVDGVATNPRWAKRITFMLNTVSNVLMGGIWGGMGQDINIDHNTVSSCGDNCIDFEGSCNSTADSNIVEDGQSGCLTTYYFASNISFSNNTVTTTNATWPLFTAENSMPSSNQVVCEQVTLNNNTFIGDGVIGVVSDGVGPTHVTVKNNNLTNAIIDISHSNTGNDVHSPVVTGNNLTFINDVPGDLTAIQVWYTLDDYGGVFVNNNTIDYQGVTQSNKIGILVQCSNPGCTLSNVTIEENSIQGCQYADIFLLQEGGAFITATVGSNTVEYAIDADEQNPNTMSITTEGNVNENGNAMPLTWLTY